MLRERLIPPLFPYTTLFRSGTTFKGTSQPLSDGAGNFYTVKLIYDCSDSWNSDGGTSTPNEKLMKGIIKARSEEHTSELQSHSDLVCRLLLEKKKKTKISTR